MALKDWKKTTYGWKKDTTATNGILDQIILSNYAYQEGAYSVRIERFHIEMTPPYTQRSTALILKLSKSKEKAIAYAKAYMRLH
jgi:hypothetical protein